MRNLDPQVVPEAVPEAVPRGPGSLGSASQGHPGRASFTRGPSGARGMGSSIQGHWQNAWGTVPALLLPLPHHQEGQRLIQEKPELAESVRKKLGQIRQCWVELESATQVKAQQLLEATQADRIVQSYAELDKQLLHMESQLQMVDARPDLASVNSNLKKMQVGGRGSAKGL